MIILESRKKAELPWSTRNAFHAENTRLRITMNGDYAKLRKELIDKLRTAMRGWQDAEPRTQFRIVEREFGRKERILSA